jgi:hypothetical protein
VESQARWSIATDLGWSGTKTLFADHFEDAIIFAVERGRAPPNHAVLVNKEKIGMQIIGSTGIRPVQAATGR